MQIKQLIVIAAFAMLVPSITHAAAGEAYLAHGDGSQAHQGEKKNRITKDSDHTDYSEESDMKKKIGKHGDKRLQKNLSKEEKQRIKEEVKYEKEQRKEERRLDREAGKESFDSRTGDRDELLQEREEQRRDRLGDSAEGVKDRTQSERGTEMRDRRDQRKEIMVESKAAAKNQVESEQDKPKKKAWWKFWQ